MPSKKEERDYFTETKMERAREGGKGRERGKEGELLMLLGVPW